MRRQNLPSELGAAVVADASVIINLCASGAGDAVLEALPQRVLMARQAIDEVTTDRRTGRADDQILSRFLSRGLVEEHSLGEKAGEIFGGLVIGAAAETLDDGEAASIALASALGIAVVIDESKANRLCLRRFPELLRLSTGDILLNDAVTARLGKAAQREAVFNALSLARMRVQQHHLQAIIALLGPDTLQLCLSLPACVRRHAQKMVSSI